MNGNGALWLEIEVGRTTITTRGGDVLLNSSNTQIFYHLVSFAYVMGPLFLLHSLSNNVARSDSFFFLSYFSTHAPFREHTIPAPPSCCPSPPFYFPIVAFPTHNCNCMS